MLKNLGDWSSQIATSAKDAASKHTADALRIAAKKIGDLSDKLQDTPLTESTMCQLIDGTGICQDYHLQQFFDTLGVTKRTPYLVVSIMGSQSSGKSTLLNHMFGTHFKEMDPNPEVYGQNTVGMWISKSLKPQGTTVFVVDNEGCDGHEKKDKKMQDLERRYALMALRASDILILNMRCGNAGLVEGANLTLWKTMIEAKLQQLSKNVRTSGSEVPMVKSTVVVVLRDVIMPIDQKLPPYREIFMRNFRKTFETAKKPQGLEGTSFEECFQVCVTGLPNYQEHESAFVKACKELRHKLTYATDHTLEAPKYGEYVPASRNEQSVTADLLPRQIKEMWDGIANDANLDWHDVQAETYRNQVAGVRTDMLTDIMHGRAWTELKRDCSETCVPDLAAQTKQFFHLAVIGMDQALEDIVCQDDRHLRRQRQQLCRILGEQMKEAFYAPTLTVIADQKWDEAMPDMVAAANKDAKKCVFDGVVKRFGLAAAVLAPSLEQVLEALGDREVQNGDSGENEEKGEQTELDVHINTKEKMLDMIEFEALRDSLDWCTQVEMEKKRLGKRWADKFGSQEEKQQAKVEFEKAQEENEKTGTAHKAAQYLINTSINGLGVVFDGAVKIGRCYVSDMSYHNNDERCNALIRYECSKAAAGGFITGLGGFAAAPFTIPTDLMGNWLLQGRLVAAIALIYGHSLEDDRIRTIVLLTVLGSSVTDIAKEFGVIVGGKVAMAALKQVPGKALIAINKRAGFRLLTKFGTTGVINLVKWIPVVGGVVGGTVSGVGAASVGKLAMENFKPV